MSARTSQIDELKTEPDWEAYGWNSRYDELAKEVAENRGALITGAAGVGKSNLLDAIERAIKIDPEARIIRGALRHAARRLIRGQTIRHPLHRCKRWQDFWLILDEFTEIPLSMRYIPLATCRGQVYCFRR